MDKIKIEFNEGNYKYCFRVPDNFNYFEMSRYMKESAYRLGEYVIYNNGKILFDKWVFVDKEKKVFDMSYDEKNNLKNILIKKLIEHEGINHITSAFAKSLKVDIEDAMNIVDFEPNSFNKKTVSFDMNFDNPYEILGIREDDYTKEELLKIVECRINNILDAYNSLVKQKLLKK